MLGEVRNLVIAALVVAGATRALASPSDYVGSARCGSCHAAELAAWQATPHARTRARFANGRSASAPARCLACHGTGDAPAGTTIAVEVGCETCHGAGTAYAPDDIMRDRPLALALGLADLSTPELRAAACARCHARATFGRRFDPTVAVHAIAKKQP